MPGRALICRDSGRRVCCRSGGVVDGGAWAQQPSSGWSCTGSSPLSCPTGDLSRHGERRGREHPEREMVDTWGHRALLRVGLACAWRATPRAAGEAPRGAVEERLVLGSGRWYEPAGGEGRTLEPSSWEGKGSNTGASREYLGSGRGQWRRCQHVWREGRDFEHPKRGRKET